MRAISSDPDIEQAVSEDGFLPIDFLTKPELKQALQVVRDIRSQIRPKVRFAIGVVHMTSKQRADLNDALQPLFQAASDRLLLDHQVIRVGLFDKGFLGQAVQLHAHPTIVDESRYRSLSIWLPLVDTSPLSGTLQVLRGSHRLTNHLRSYDDFDLGYEKFTGRRVNPYSTAVSRKAGQGILFDDRLLHWSPVNYTFRTRTALQVVLVPREAKMQIYYRKNSTELEKFALEKATYAYSSMTKKRPEDMVSLGTRHQPEVNPSFENFRSLMNSIQ